MAQGRFAEAASLGQEVLDASGSDLSEAHPVVLDAAFQKTRALGELEQWDAAEGLALGVYSARFEKLGAEHPDTAEALQWVIDIYEALGSTEAAETYKAVGVGESRASRLVG